MGKLTLSQTENLMGNRARITKIWWWNGATGRSQHPKRGFRAIRGREENISLARWGSNHFAHHPLAAGDPVHVSLFFLCV